MVNIACVGVGYWGKNLVRTFYTLKNVRLQYCCDLDETKLDVVKEQYRDIRVTRSFEEVVEDPEVEAVVLASHASAHYPLAKKALEAGKHVYVEKPMTLRVEDAADLVRIADQEKRVLMVGHLMEYHPGVSKLKELVARGELGEIYYLYAQRVNLGIVRKDENALWSFAPHDLSIVLYLLDEEPDTVSARGESYLQERIEDVVFVNLHFRDRKMAQLQLSWLDPHKIRRLTVVGSRKMVVFDDVESTEKVKIYDRGVDRVDYDSYGDSLTLRFGDITIPKIDMTEPLRIECQHFLDCLQHGKTPRSDGWDGLRVVRVLDAAQRSLDQGGVPVKLN